MKRTVTIAITSSFTPLTTTTIEASPGSSATSQSTTTTSPQYSQVL